MNRYYLTQDRFEELKSELENLKTNKRIQVAERLKAAKEYGDLSENSEYTEAKEEQSQLETRIIELEDILKNVAIIDKSSSKDKIGVGSVITVKRGNEIKKYSIVGSNETNPEEGKISNESPLGEALLGHKVGDKVCVRTPNGEVNYVISHIE